MIGLWGILRAGQFHQLRQGESEFSAPDLTHHRQASGRAELGELCVADISVFRDVEQVEHREGHTLYAEMVPLDALTVNFSLQGEVAAKGGQRLANTMFPCYTPVRVSVRRVYVQLSSAYPLQTLFRWCHQRLLSAIAPATG
jgi:hypothetical protein